MNFVAASKVFRFVVGGSKLSPRALPYVEAMMNLESMNDAYGHDNAEGVIAYFLANAKQWNGPVARKVKTHLRELLRKKSN